MGERNRTFRRKDLSQEDNREERDHLTNEVAAAWMGSETRINGKDLLRMSGSLRKSEKRRKGV
jgi:hypothetical protein